MEQKVLESEKERRWYDDGGPLQPGACCALLTTINLACASCWRGKVPIATLLDYFPAGLGQGGLCELLSACRGSFGGGRVRAGGVSRISWLSV